MMSFATRPAQRGIYFGDRRFTEPLPFDSAQAIPSQGIYAILVRDESFLPRPFQVISFGESEKLAKCVTPEHESYDNWLRQARGVTLYVAYYNTTGTTSRQRRELASRLIREYNPPCNDRAMNPNYQQLNPAFGK